MIEVYFSTDGKQTIHVQTETTEELNKLLPYAKELYKRVCNEFGTKVQMWGEVMNGNGKVKEQPKQENLPYPAPLCTVHKQPLEYKEGPYGWFWGCQVKLPNGEWCKAKARSADLRLREAVNKVV
ncbi:MAG: hypothetical protein UR93_C0017G0001 [Berkelbacteria bacterium GW2011_GWA2_35_9]|uniref:Uncharacterized protein n=1 Tax=Berkelbacteria bacterium GW2011_GWA2_35_9 TaxID=1618333 RepID=A0A0G0DHS9_9BACT|nr:MAG: hypothetical protein UR93_C0017G0001 [Berkelbacteria bacterium GW2011_GWA2_35_9]